MNRQALVDQLVQHEELRLKPYMDTTGNITIGVGRNLTGKGISSREAFDLLDHDIDECIADLATFAWFGRANQVRQLAVIDLRFNLGPDRFREFKHFIHYMAIEDYPRAAAELRRSAWFGQVKSRGPALARMIETGES
jgi:lysozyme